MTPNTDTCRQQLTRFPHSFVTVSSPLFSTRLACQGWEGRVTETGRECPAMRLAGIQDRPDCTLTWFSPPRVKRGFNLPPPLLLLVRLCLCTVPVPVLMHCAYAPCLCPVLALLWAVTEAHPTRRQLDAPEKPRSGHTVSSCASHGVLIGWRSHPIQFHSGEAKLQTCAADRVAECPRC